MVDNKKIQSDLNRVIAQLNQLETNDLFSENDRQNLRPIYKRQIEDLNKKLAITNNYQNFKNRAFA